MQRGPPGIDLRAGPGLLMSRIEPSHIDERGFTIVEVLIAVLVLAVGLLAVFGALVSSNQLSSGAQIHEAAITFAEEQLDNLRQELGQLGTATLA